MTRQEIFNKVKTHLLKQNKQAKSGGNCLYLNRDNGTRCAVGCLIPDGHPGLDVEGGVFSLLYTHPDLMEDFGVAHRSREDETFRLLVALQGVHDNADPEDWPNHLRRVAEGFELAYEESPVCPICQEPEKTGTGAPHDECLP